MSKLKVKLAGKLGRGVFAARDLKSGEVIEVSPCIYLDRKDSLTIVDTKLNFYVFGAGENNRDAVLALGLGSLFNHKRTSNVEYTYDDVSNEMIFELKKDVKKGEQLFINYGYDPVKELKKFEKRGQVS